MTGSSPIVPAAGLDAVADGKIDVAAPVVAAADVVVAVAVVAAVVVVAAARVLVVLVDARLMEDWRGYIAIKTDVKAESDDWVGHWGHGASWLNPQRRLSDAEGLVVAELLMVWLPASEPAMIKTRRNHCRSSLESSDVLLVYELSQIPVLLTLVGACCLVAEDTAEDMIPVYTSLECTTKDRTVRGDKYKACLLVEDHTRAKAESVAGGGEGDGRPDASTNDHIHYRSCT